MNIADLRREYTAAGLREEDLAADPFTQFDRWLRQAVEAGVHEPNAMTLATAGADGVPSARMVLLKAVDRQLPLNSPARYPQYNGSMERNMRDLHAALEARETLEVPLPVKAELVTHQLDHRYLRSLHHLTPCQVYHDRLGASVCTEDSARKFSVKCSNRSGIM